MGGEASKEGKGTTGTASEGEGEQVILHVYDPIQGQSRMPGMGIYHSGLEVFGTEYTFGGSESRLTGIVTHRPKKLPGMLGQAWKYKQSIVLGRTTKLKVEVKEMWAALKPEWPGNSYEVTSHNCNHFTKAFSEQLGVGGAYPSWVNRMARIGSNFKGTVAKRKEKQEVKQAMAMVESLKIKGEEVGDLQDVVDQSKIGCSNALSDHSLPPLFDVKLRKKKGTFLQSKDGDPQLLLYIPFKAPVKLYELQLEFQAKDIEAMPRTLHLFKNKPTLDFEDVESFKPTETVVIKKPEPGKEAIIKAKLPLKKVKWQNITYLTIFVEDNQSGEDGDIEYTKINKINLIGVNVVMDARSGGG